MSPQVVSRFSVHRLFVLALVGAILFVPAAVRATQSASGPSLIRLNRGFDVPVEPDLAPPADTASLVPASIGQPEVRRVVAIQQPADAHDVLPDTPDTLDPDLLRGPPSSSAA